jgi:hypothetical protein
MDLDTSLNPLATMSWREVKGFRTRLLPAKLGSDQRITSVTEDTAKANNQLYFVSMVTRRKIHEDEHLTRQTSLPSILCGSKVAINLPCTFQSSFEGNKVVHYYT